MREFGMLIDILFAIFSSFLLILAFPEFYLSFLTWIGLVPLLLVITGSRLKYSFFLSWLSGGIFFAGIFNWILEVPGYSLLHHALLGLYLGSYFALFGMVFSFISRRIGITASLFAAPFVWVSLEYFRSNMSFLALPWGLLAHSQYQQSIILQIASITGAYGVTFLIVLVNSAITAVVYPLFWRLRRHKTFLYEHSERFWKIAVVVTAVVMTSLTVVFGNFVISRPLNDKKIKVSVIQGNIVQSQKWDIHYAKSIMQTYADLTREASQDEPDLIVWPEAATPGPITRNLTIYREVLRIAHTAGAYLLLGSSGRQKFRKDHRKKKGRFNSAFLIHPTYGIDKNRRYDKIRLLPFGEYLPMKGSIPWHYLSVPDIGQQTPGRENTVFKLPGYRFGVTICWENIFAGLVRQFANRDAQFIVNITNEAWFKKSAAPYQFVSMSVFRAVENRTSVIRCANTGVSCFIDPYGRVTDKLKVGGKDIFVKGFLTHEIPLSDGKTFYTVYGDVFVYLCIWTSVPLTILSFFGLRKNRWLQKIRSTDVLNC